jgi:hypothetical protein
MWPSASRSWNSLLKGGTPFRDSGVGNPGLVGPEAENSAFGQRASDLSETARQRLLCADPSSSAASSASLKGNLRSVAQSRLLRARP